MSSPLVTVGMPVYNAGSYLAESIESILNQTFQDFEFIIIDDASTDNSWEVLKSYQKKDTRIRIYRNTKNLYIAKNRNEILKKVRGKYLVWQDADDISLPYRIEKQVAFMEENPAVGICGGWLESFKGDITLDTRKYFPDDLRLRNNIFRASPVAQPASIVRKICFDKVGVYNSDYPPAEDIDMSFRIGAHYKFANLQFPVIRYREHENSATSRKLRKIIMITLKIRISNIRNRQYFFNSADLFALVITYFVQFLPSSFIVKLFKLLRPS